MLRRMSCLKIAKPPPRGNEDKKRVCGGIGLSKNGFTRISRYRVHMSHCSVL